MIFRKTQNGEIFTYEFVIDMESCFEIRDRIFKALWPDLSTRLFNLRFRYDDKNIIDLNTSLIDLVPSQDEVIECDIVQMIEGNVQVYSILETGEQVTISFNSSKNIMRLKEDISNRLRYNIDDFTLFLEFEWLDEEAFIYQYEIQDGSVIKYVFLDKIENLEIRDSGIKLGNHSRSFIAKTIPRGSHSKGEVIRIKRYKSKSPSSTVETYKPMIREIVSFNKIRDSPRFVQLKAFYMHDNEFLLGMELMTGGTLHEYIERRGPLEENIIAQFSQQILEALNELDELHIYHCYLNSQNILLDENRQVKISGFSLSRFFAGKTCEEMVEDFTVSKVPPTYNFSAPEIFYRGDSGLKSDIWSFGAVLVHMVTGRIPFDGLNNDEILDYIDANGTIPFEAPSLGRESQIRILIDRCLQVDMDDRPSPKVLLEDFSESFNVYSSL